MMDIIPSIDLQNGRCVRLYQGRFDKVTHYEGDPIKVAESYVQEGASLLHIVDLDGVQQGQVLQADLIQQLCDIPGLMIQVGGGIRSQTQIETLLELGVNRLVIGSAAIMQMEQVKQWLYQYGAEKIVLALDVLTAYANVHEEEDEMIPFLVTHAWKNQSNQTLWGLMQQYCDDAPLRYVLCTDISRDGTLTGANLQLYAEFKQRFPAIYLQASGGIGAIVDLCQLKSIGVDAVIVGKALYEHQFTLPQAVAEVKKC